MLRTAPHAIRWSLTFLGVFVLLGLGLGLAGVTHAFDPLGDRSDLPFDAAAWRRMPPETRFSSPRLRMVSDLVASGVLIERSTSEVEDLLGPPSDHGSVLWEYEVGPEPWGLDPFRAAHLSLRFDARGRVRECFLAGT